MKPKRLPAFARHTPMMHIKSISGSLQVLHRFVSSKSGLAFLFLMGCAPPPDPDQQPMLSGPPGTILSPFWRCRSPHRSPHPMSWFKSFSVLSCAFELYYVIDSKQVSQIRKLLPYPPELRGHIEAERCIAIANLVHSLSLSELASDACPGTQVKRPNGSTNIKAKRTRHQ